MGLGNKLGVHLVLFCKRMFSDRVKVSSTEQDAFGGGLKN